MSLLRPRVDLRKMNPALHGYEDKVKELYIYIYWTRFVFFFFMASFLFNTAF
jgi:hypothetical protein